MSTTILLVDDHELIREGLRRAFERDPNFEVVAEAGSLAAALNAAERHNPDVVIMDMKLPDGSGLEGVRKLRTAKPAIGIVVLTMFAGDDAVLGALDAGASGFVPKDAPSDDVLAAARYAAAMPRNFSAPSLADAVKRKLSPPGPQLSARERQVLQLLADGKAVAGIAKELYISVSTAKTHVAKVYEKLGAQNRAQALMTAMKMGLLSAN